MRFSRGQRTVVYVVLATLALSLVIGLWPVSADRGLRLRPGVRGGLGTPVKWVLRKAMRWYVEPLAYDQRSFNAAVLRLTDDLQARIDELERELGAVRAGRDGG